MLLFILTLLVGFFVGITFIIGLAIYLENRGVKVVPDVPKPQTFKDNSILFYDK